MATVEELVRDVLGSHAVEAGAPVVVRWANDKYQELVSKSAFRHLRKVGELEVPAVVTNGTVTTARGNTAVTGVLTTWQTSLGLGAQQYWYFRASSAWYKVASVGGELSLTLATNFSEDAVTAGAYTLSRRLHPLASTARFLKAVIHTRLRRPLDLISLDEMDIRYPGRVLAGMYPLAVAQVGFDTNNRMMVEAYPPPNVSEILHYVYYDLPSALAIASTIPSDIDAQSLKEGILVDLYRYKMAQAADNGKVEVAALWRNEARAQDTKWQNVIKDAARIARGVDDLAFVLERFGNAQHTLSDQRTARDIVLDRWHY